MTSQAPQDAGPDLAEKVAFLRGPRAYAEGTREVIAIETRTSWVFLAGDIAYKLRKAAQCDAPNFHSLDVRLRICEEEVQLNRRLAPAVYLGTVPLTRTAAGGLAVDGAGEPVDWLVKMRRLPASRMLDNAIRNGTVKTRELKHVSRLLAKFFADAVPVAMPPSEYRRRLAHTVTENRRILADPQWGLPRRLVEDITATLRKMVMGRAPVFDRRVRRGRIREGHGDLRAEHVFLGPKVAIIDCLDFGQDFRIRDSLDELCFLAVDCEVHGSPGAGKVILETCCERLGDEPPANLIAFYKALRAMTQAGMAIRYRLDGTLAIAPQPHRQAEPYLALAGQYARQMA